MTERRDSPGQVQGMMSVFFTWRPSFGPKEKENGRRIAPLLNFEANCRSTAKEAIVPSKGLWILLSVVLVAPLLLPRVLAAPHDEPNDEDGVRKIVAGFPESWNRHDMEAFGKLFAADADFVNVAGNWWKGREEIQAQHAFSHGTIPADTKGFEAARAYYGIFKASTLRLTQIDVRFLRSDVAVAHASCELLGDARTPNPRHCVLTFVLTRQDGNWFIAAAHNTEINRTVK